MGRLTKRINGIWDADRGAGYNSLDCAEKLAHYEDLEEAGRLIELPCKVGDTVYLIGTFTGQLTEDKVCTIETNNTGIILVLNCGWAVFVEQQLGNTVFLTKEEAEAKLKELKG